ncbi:MAG TPA: DUF2974 domain-containing protein [Candidatus Megaira endosymbiont of Nemacystus decipiens]|nr:DUF2974 domain-containing protein [Candidatus Megaera endosymbiont of Nemacystus decipiens]
MEYENCQNIIDQAIKVNSLLDLSIVNINKQNLENLYYKIKESGFSSEIRWGQIPSRSKRIITRIERQLISNYQQHSLYPNDFIHSLLSLHSYEEIDKKQGIVHFEKDIEYNQYLGNWEIQKIFDDEKNGYYAVIYINKALKQLVLAHRGTKIEGNTKLQQLFGLFTKQDSDLQTDIKGVFGKEVVSQQLAAYYATQEAVAYAKENQYHLSTTGHSLGAWLSEMSAYYCHRDFAYHDIKVVNFDSPGSAAHMDDFNANVKNHETKFEPKNIDIVTYLSAPNIVNSCNQHFGKVYRVFPEVLSADQIKHHIKWICKIPIIGKKLENNSFILNGILSLSGHNLRGIIKTFNPETKKPQKYMKVIHWPVIEYKAKNSLSDTIIDTIANNIPTSVLSLCFKKIVRGTIKRYSYNSSILSAINILGHFLNGEIDLNQYFQVYKNISHSTIMDKEYQLDHTSSEKDNFSILYKNHYQLAEVDEYSEIINTSNKGSIDWYISRLNKCSEKKLRQGLPRITSHKIISLKRGYKIIVKCGNKHIVTKEKQYSVDDIKQKIAKTLNSDSKIKEILEKI